MPRAHITDTEEPTATVLHRSYSAASLIWLYETSLERLAKEHPYTLPPITDSQRHGKLKVPRKAYLVDLLVAVFEDEELCGLFFNSLPDATQAVLSVLTWQREILISELEDTAGVRLADLNPDKRKWNHVPFIIRKEHGFVCFTRGRWDYYASYNETPEKSAFMVCLPREIRRAFRPAIPKPADYNLLPLDDMDDVALRYTCAPQAVRDMKLVAEYIQQGHLKYTKAEKISKPCIRHIQAMTPGAEFFKETDDRDLELLRTRLLIGAMAFAGETARERLLASSEAEPVRALYETLEAAPAFFAEELQDHLLGSRRSWIDYDSDGVKKLTTFFAKLPAGKWVSFDNIRRYHALRDREPTLFSHPPIGFDARASRVNDHWRDRVYVDFDNILTLATDPLLQGYAFFLAALGMAEIAYEEPKNEHYCHPRKPYLTPFDGLLGIRLTPLGEFVLGKRKTYDIESDTLHHAVVALDATRLLASCPDIDPLTELALKQFMTPLTPGHYQMTHKSLLGGCASRKELEERIRLFRRVISETPPPIWERFFESTLSRIAPLEPEPDRVVLKIDSDDEIRRLFASDPILRKHCLKVEGLRVAVLRSDMKTIAKRLAHFGYLCPVASMRPKESAKR